MTGGPKEIHFIVEQDKVTPIVKTINLGTNNKTNNPSNRNTGSNSNSKSSSLAKTGMVGGLAPVVGGGLAILAGGFAVTRRRK